MLGSYLRTVLVLWMVICTRGGKKTPSPTMEPTAPIFPAISTPWGINQDASFITFNNSYAATVLDANDNAYLVMSQGPVYFCAANSTNCMVIFGTTNTTFKMANGAAVDLRGRLYVADKFAIYQCSLKLGCRMALQPNLLLNTISQSLWLYGVTFDSTYKNMYFTNYDANVQQIPGNCLPDVTGKIGGALGENCDPTIPRVIGYNNYIGKCLYNEVTGTINSCTKLIPAPVLGYHCGPSSIKTSTSAYDPAGTSLWVVCSFNGVLVQCAADGTSCANVTQNISGGLPERLNSPTDVIVDPFYGTLYISDTGNGRILQCTPDGATCSLLIDNRYMVGPGANLSFLVPPTYTDAKVELAAFGYMGASGAQRTLYITDARPVTWAVQLLGTCESACYDCV